MKYSKKRKKPVFKEIPDNRMITLMYDYYLNSLHRTIEQNKNIKNIQELQELNMKNFDAFLERKDMVEFIQDNVFILDKKFYGKAPYNAFHMVFDERYHYSGNFALVLLYLVFPHIRYSNKTFYEKFLRKGKKIWENQEK